MENDFDLFVQAADAIAVMQDGILKLVNKALVKMLGYSREELLGMSFAQLLAPDCRDSVSAKHQDILNDKAISPIYETEAVTKEGTILNIEIIAALTEYEGHSTGVLIMRQISERKQVGREEEESFPELEVAKAESNLPRRGLSRSEDHCRYSLGAGTGGGKGHWEINKAVAEIQDLLDALPFYILLVDASHHIVMANKAVQDSFGVDPEQIVGGYCPKIIHGIDGPFSGCPLEEAVEKGCIVERELFDSKSKRWIKSVVYPTRYQTQEGQTVFIHFAQDITERKKVEEALRESEEKLRSMFENANDAIALIDLNGNFVDVNENALRILGLSSKEEILGKNNLQFVAPNDLDAVVEDIQKILQLGHISGVAYSALRKDGSLVPVELNASLIKDSQGNPSGIIGIIRDVSERKAIEEEQQRAVRLESIGTLAGGIAHDFNNILTGVLGNISLAKRYAESKSKEEVNERLEEAEKASLRARDLIRQLLTFSRGGAPVKKLTSVGTLINDSATFALRGSNVNHSLSIPSNLWTAEVDEGQMSQLIHNLVINADQAMPQGGTINIKAKNTIIKTKSTLPLPEGRYIEVIVEDHGVGIPKEHLDRIFDPYFTTKQKGSGLGLATCYSIIRNHGGHIMVSSRMRKGTTFRIYLPASGKAVTKNEEAITKAPVTGEGRILVMDDEMPIRGLLDHLLTGIGNTVELVSDGSDAIKAYQKAKEAGKPFDAVILDLTVPGAMGGKDAMRELLEIDPDVKAVVSSGYATDPIMSEYTKYGFSAVITKPYKVEELEQILHIVITGEEK